MGLWVGPRRGAKSLGRDLERAAFWASGFRLPPAALACRSMFLSPPPPPRRPPAHSWASGGLVLGMPRFFTVGPTQSVAARAGKRCP